MKIQMKIFYLLTLLIFVSCSTNEIANENIEENINEVDEVLIIETPSPVPTSTPITKPSSGEMKYNHPEIKNDQLTSVEKQLDQLNDDSDGNFSIFINVLQATNMMQKIITLDEITLLVPDNTAFDLISLSLLEKISTNPDFATEIIEAHILPFEFKESNIKKFSHLDTLSGGSIDIENIDRKPIINSSISIVQKDIKIENGYIHIIDGIVLPENISTESQTVEKISIYDVEAKNLKVVSLELVDKTYNFHPDFTLIINFDSQQKYSGRYLCNNIFGSYKITSGGYLEISDHASTKMACFPPSPDIELNTDLIWKFLSRDNLQIERSIDDNKEIFINSLEEKIYLYNE